ncbi:NUDIX domain-containing protein [Reyranella sp.]|uniref:NUDIX domain-containing protein n=1 Tax=Reyranella sp. TaxID=1929291 RepID=UPI003BA9E613
MPASERTETEGVDVANPWRVEGTASAFDCRYFEVRQDTVSLAGRPSQTYSSIRVRYFGVCALPVDGQGRVALIGQYRYVLDRFTWEVPGGGAAAGSDPLVTARMELEEETGWRARQWLKLVEAAVSPGTSSEVTPAYVAWDLEETRPADNEDELLSRRWVPFREAVDMALLGQIGNLPGVAAILALETRFRRGDLPESLARLLR